MFVDKAKRFLIKIQDKNRLKEVLKQKKAELAKVSQYPDLIDNILELREEIKIIELELKKFD